MRIRHIASVLAVAAVLALVAVSAMAAPKTVTIKVEGMTCGGCATSIEKALRAADGVLAAHVSFERGEASVRYDDRKTTVARLRDVIDSTGFKAVAGLGSSAKDEARASSPTGAEHCAEHAATSAICAPPAMDATTTATEVTYSTDLAGLRAQFNRDKGKVRLLMVLSPT